jgi:predicted ArsR family transcriptional regulator
MSGPPPPRDDAILARLRLTGPAGTTRLAAELGFYERRVRRGLRQLIQRGYVFSPERGLYRITAAGAAAIAPVPDQHIEAHDSRPMPGPRRRPSNLYTRLGRRR